jgi:predicted GH43/DUF377 family glycosyl hydrolase
MPIYRSSENPILQPKDVPPSRPGYEVIGVINTGVARMGNEVILLLRVVERPINSDPSVYPVPIYDPQQNDIILKMLPKNAPGYDFSDPRVFVAPDGVYLSAISHLRAARSQDGIHFKVDAAPALSSANAYEAFGLEDPRVTPIGSNYYITYVGVSGLGIVTSLASTRDFQAYKRLGVIFPPDNKDVMLFPEKINHRYYILHRPSTSGLGKPEMWLAESPDLVCWGNHRRLVGLRPGEWDGERIGGGAPPLRIAQGWLEIYHGADRNNRYSLGALLLDAHDPSRVLARSATPIFQPEADYEVRGFFGNVVFTCGALLEEGKVKLYYGAADTCIAYAEIPLEDILANLGVK